MRLVFGINDVPYPLTGQSTGTVSEILERQYGIVVFYLEQYGQYIADKIAEGTLSEFEERANALAAAMFERATESKLFSVAKDIEDSFKQMIDNREMDGKVPGVPTQASLRGVNHRLSQPYAKANPVRASFVDTGLYRDNITVRIEE